MINFKEQIYPYFNPDTLMHFVTFNCSNNIADRTSCICMNMSQEIFNTGHIESICDNKFFSCTLVCRACLDLPTQAGQLVTY